MPGLYSHTTRAAGTVVTATIYNGDHQNHIDNQTPDKTDDWSTDVTQMRLTADPYPAQASESSATSLDGELTRLRYILGQLASFCNGGAGIAAATTALGTNLGQWYFGIRNPAFKTVGARVYKSTALTHAVSGTRQACTFDTERYDQDGAGTGFHSTVSNTERLTVPANLAGKYHIGGVAAFPSSATGDLREVAVRLNGTTFIGGTRTSWAHLAQQTVEINICVDYALAAADYVELIINQDIGASQSIGGPDNVAGPEFWCHLIGS